MKNPIITEYLSKLKYANSEEEIDQVLEDILPALRRSGISPHELMVFMKMNGGNYGFEPKTQDHRSTHSNASKAQIIMQKIMAKLKK